MSNTTQLKYDFELDNIDKPLSKSDLSQKIEKEKRKSSILYHLLDEDVKVSLLVCIIGALCLFATPIVFMSIELIINSSSNDIYFINAIKSGLVFTIIPLMLALSIIYSNIISALNNKKHVNKLKNDPNYVVNQELNQLNDQLVDKNEPYKIRYLYELIKDGDHVSYQTIVNDDNTCKLIITVDDKFIRFDKNNYSEQDLELIEQFNTHYKLNTNKDILYFFEQNVNNHIDKDVINSRFDAQSLQELHDKTEKIKNLAQRN